MLWNSHSKSSDWISQEIGIAQEGDKIIILVLLDEEFKPPAFISDIKYLAAYNDFEDSITELQEEVNRRAEKFQKVSGAVSITLGLGLLFLLFSGE